MEEKKLLSLIEGFSQKDKELVKKAFKYAKNAHRGVKRFSGDPYFTHPLEAAKIAAGNGYDATTIAATLLHDTIDDGKATPDDFEKEFGKEMQTIVQGVSELGDAKYRGSERHVEALRKLVFLISKDVRILVVKFIERVHNLRTLEHVKKEKRKRIAVESIEVYATVANRLGMGKLKAMLEDAAFPYVSKTTFEKTKKLIAPFIKKAEERLKHFEKSLYKKLAEEGLKDFHIKSRVKHLYSIHKKLEKYDMNPNRLYDLLAIRVLTKTSENCYKVLGAIHGTWKPVTGRLKDYIASPKTNGYQSIHTSVFVGDGSIVEIQIRTEEMNRVAELGAAAHIAYTEGNKKKTGGEFTKNNRWLQQLLENNEEIDASDFFEDRIFVFTPKGEVVELPKGSTPVDFAFLIHTDIGKRMGGAYINQKFVSLDTEIKSGDMVEIKIKKTAKPSAKWLEIAKTSEAKRKIRQALKG